MSSNLQAQKKSPSARKDPPARAVDRSLQQGAIKNADPSKHYVWAYKVGEGGVALYENRGYDVEVKRPGGVVCVSVRRNAPDGAPIEWEGNVLMSIDKAVLEEDHAAAQAEVDRVERKILSPVGAVDGLRGINGVRGRDNRPVVGLEDGVNETSSYLGS